MKERIGEHYRLFTMEINGIRYYLISRRNEKGFCFLSNKSEQAVETFELLEKYSITQYDLMLDKMHAARKEEEKKTGRRMTIKERIDFCNNFEKNYYHNKEAN